MLTSLCTCDRGPKLAFVKSGLDMSNYRLRVVEERLLSNDFTFHTADTILSINLVVPNLFFFLDVPSQPDQMS